MSSVRRHNLSKIFVHRRSKVIKTQSIFFWSLHRFRRSKKLQLKSCGRFFMKAGFRRNGQLTLFLVITNVWGHFSSGVFSVAVWKKIQFCLLINQSLRRSFQNGSRSKKHNEFWNMLLTDTMLIVMNATGILLFLLWWFMQAYVRERHSTSKWTKSILKTKL